MRRPADKEKLRARFYAAVLGDEENYKKYTTNGEPSIRKVGESIKLPHAFTNVTEGRGEPTWDTVAYLVHLLGDPDLDGWLYDAGFGFTRPAPPSADKDEQDVLDLWHRHVAMHQPGPHAKRETKEILRRLLQLPKEEPPDEQAC